MTTYPQSYAKDTTVRFISPSGEVKESAFASREVALAEALRLAESGVPVWDWEDEEWINAPAK